MYVSVAVDLLAAHVKAQRALAGLMTCTKTRVQLTRWRGSRRASNFFCGPYAYKTAQRAPPDPPPPHAPPTSATAAPRKQASQHTMDPNVQPVTDFPTQDSPYVPMPTTFAQPRDPKARPNVYPRPTCDPEKTAIIPAANTHAYPVDPTNFFRGQDVTQERRMRDRNNAAAASAAAAAAAAAAAPPQGAPSPAASASADYQSSEALPYTSTKSSKKASRQRSSRQSSSRGSTVPRHLATSSAWSPAARQPRQKSSSTRNTSHSPY